MGNQSAKQAKGRIQRYNSSLSHPILQYATLTKNKDKEQEALELSTAVSHEQLCDIWKSKIQKYRIPYLDNEVLFLPNEVIYESAGMCGTGGIAKAIFNAPPLTLHQELENRISIMQPFQQPEIWYILYVLVYAAAQLHSRNLIIGDVRPKNIFLFKDGQISIGCSASFFDETSNYIKSSRERQRTFLAPQQTVQLQNHKTLTKDPQNGQNFSVGLTILSLMLLHDLQLLYFNASQQVLDIDKLSKQLSNISDCQIYSQQLKKIVFGLLKLFPEQRLGCSQILKMLKPYQYNIINLEQFSIQPTMIPTQIATKLAQINLDDYKLQQKSLIDHDQSCEKSYQFIASYLKPFKQQKMSKTLQSYQHLPAKNQLSTEKSQQVVANHQLNQNRRQKNSSSLMVVNGLEYNPLFSPSNFDKSELNNMHSPHRTVDPPFILQQKLIKARNEDSKCYDNFSQNSSNQQKYETFLTNDDSRGYKGSKSMDIINSDTNKLNDKDTETNLSKKYTSDYQNQRIQNLQNSEDKSTGKYNNIKGGNFQKDANRISFNKNIKQQMPKGFTTPTPLEKNNQFRQAQSKLLNVGQTRWIEDRSYKNGKQLKLQDMGRQTKSIRPPSQYKLTPNSNFEHIMRNIDQQVSKSRRMFPEKN